VYLMSKLFWGNAGVAWMVSIGIKCNVYTVMIIWV
jgi:hypothetical protein